MIINRIDVMLAKRKMRSKDLAAALGATEANMSKLKTGQMKGIKFDTLDRLCAVLDCQPGELFEYVPDAPGGKAGAGNIRALRRASGG